MTQYAPLYNKNLRIFWFFSNPQIFVKREVVFMLLAIRKLGLFGFALGLGGPGERKTGVGLALFWVCLGSFWLWGALVSAKWGSDWVCLGLLFGRPKALFFRNPFRQLRLHSFGRFSKLGLFCTI
jgi:hypothetical protein